MSCSRLSWLCRATSMVRSRSTKTSRASTPSAPPAVGVAAPLDEHGGEVAVVLPVARLDQGQDAGAVGARLGAEDAITRPRLHLVEAVVRRSLSSSAR